MSKQLWPNYWFLILLAAISVNEVPIQFNGKNCYMGVLHSHTVMCPDFVPQPSNVDAFKLLLMGNSNERFSIPNGPLAEHKRVADFGKLDFLAVTDHAAHPRTHQRPRTHETRFDTVSPFLIGPKPKSCGSRTLPNLLG